MLSKEKRIQMQKEREPFKFDLKIYLKINKISQRALCNGMEVSEQEFYNMLNGFQDSIPSKNIDSFEDFQTKIYKELCITSL